MKLQNWFLIFLLVCLVTSQSASAEVTENTDENTGTRQVMCSPTIIDAKTFTLTSCIMSPLGNQNYRVTHMDVVFGPLPTRPEKNQHPEWRNVPSIGAKAAVYTPYRKIDATIIYSHLDKIDALLVRIRPADYIHMTRCQKARIVYGKLGITLRAQNLEEMATIVDYLGPNASIVPSKDRNAQPAKSKEQQTQSTNAMSVSRNDEGETILTFNLATIEDGEETRVKSQFTLPAGKGLLGPSSNPGDQKGFSNKEKTIFAVNNQPVTKSSYVYVFLKKASSSIQMIDNVNKKVAKLLPSEQSELALDFLRVQKILGRNIYVQTVDFLAEGRPTFNYCITINEDGSINLK